MSKDKEVKVETWQDLEFTPLDGKTRLMKEFFKETDFAKGENDNVFIKYAALLRVMKKIFIVGAYETNIVQVPEKGNDWCATIQARFVFACPEAPSQPMSWAACADCHKGNSMPGFEKYTTTVAETRAAARALRNILGIELCSKEELADTTQDLSETLPIQNHQQVLLETKFIGEMGISLDEMKKILERDFTTLEELTRVEAAKLIEKLNGRRTKKEKSEK